MLIARSARILIGLAFFIITTIPASRISTAAITSKTILPEPDDSSMLEDNACRKECYKTYIREFVACPKCADPHNCTSDEQQTKDSCEGSAATRLIECRKGCKSAS